MQRNAPIWIGMSDAYGATRSLEYLRSNSDVHGNMKGVSRVSSSVTSLAASPSQRFPLMRKTILGSTVWVYPTVFTSTSVF